MLTNFPECRAHLTGGGKTHPPPLDTLGFQLGIHFTCMAIDRQWSPLILQLLRFDLKFVNAVTYVIITNIFHGYVYMLTFLAAISLSLSLSYIFPLAFSFQQIDFCIRILKFSHMKPINSYIINTYIYIFCILSASQEGIVKFEFILRCSCFFTHTI